MLFHTWPFLLFFLLVYLGYLALRKTGFRLHWLLVASWFFYSWWNPLYLPLIIFSTLVDYYAVVFMDRTGRRKLGLILSLVNNLGLLFFFKYAEFFGLREYTDTVWSFFAGFSNDVFDAWGVSYRVPLKAVLPVGISFYTFQSMSYTIDFYRGHIQREESFVRFAAYVALFPQLVAGPIERASHLLPQLRKEPQLRLQDLTDGASLFIVGLFKKVALANYLGQYVDKVYVVPDQYGSPALMLATFAFAWQIYFDFSGYTDMARGVGRAFGFRFMLNFNHPYLATGLGDFWSRWHISLSTWFRDYVYTPLGGNRRGTLTLYRNLFLTFVISGFWHGAAWTFIIWGGLHALVICVTRRLERSTWYKSRVPRMLKMLWVFLFVCLAWVFFRAESLEDAMTILTRIFSGPWEDPGFPILALVLVALVWLYQYLHETRWRFIVENSLVKIALVVVMLLYLFLLFVYSAIVLSVLFESLFNVLNLALLIFVSRYDSSDFHPLPFAEKDISALAEVLISKAKFKKDNVRILSHAHTLKTKNFKWVPTAKAIRRELRFLVANAEKKDVVLIAFAGHGVQFSGKKENYFCPSDTDLREKKTLIAIQQEVYRFLEKECKARVKLLFVDACRSDPRTNSARHRTVNLQKLNRPQQLELPRGIAAFYSCKAGEVAYEHKKLGHGVFFHFVLEGLKGKAADSQGGVSLSTLRHYVKKQVVKYVDETFNEVQTPILRENSSDVITIIEQRRQPVIYSNARKAMDALATRVKSVLKDDLRKTIVTIRSFEAESLGGNASAGVVLTKTFAESLKLRGVTVSRRAPISIRGTYRVKKEVGGQIVDVNISLRQFLTQRTVASMTVSFAVKEIILPIAPVVKDK